MAFDVLYWDRRDLTGRPLRDRRARLEDIVAGSELVFSVRGFAPDGLDAWARVVERGYEGCVAKDEASMYEDGATRCGRVIEERSVAAADQRAGASRLNYHWRLTRRVA
jgi:hypothetical protein